jgi:hypothetical protein
MSTLSSPGGTGEGAEKIPVTVYLRWGFLFQSLLRAAKDLNDKGHHEAAIVAAQTSCEVCTEMVLTETFEIRGVPEYLSDTLGVLLGKNYNVGNPRVREIYEAVTEDPIYADGKARWYRFKEHTKKRHAVVHKGESATKADADASIKVVQEIIEHILQHHDAKWRQS